MNVIANHAAPRHPAIIADGIIFDLDGTLWDASATCTNAWNEALKQSGNERHAVDSDRVRSFSGLRIQTIFERHFAHIPAESHPGILELYIKYERLFIGQSGGVLYPGVEATLPVLRTHWKLFIVSNCLPGYIENFLTFNHLHQYFQDTECSGDTGLPKSQNIRSIIQRNALRYPIYVGDTRWDYDAAGTNDIPFIYAAYGFGHCPEATWTISRFDELPHQLRYD